MYADHVTCNNCDKIMYVVIGTDVCPKCKARGTLSWVNDENPEIDVCKNEIINLADYEKVINDTEISAN